MSTDALHRHDARSEVIAFAFVVESSIAVSSQWRTILLDYVTPLFRRLHETHHGYSLHLGIVTYATADTLPTPLLCKRFFTPFQQVLKDMKSDQAKLGIGTTSAGGSRGMAALEGIVAAIELFAIFQESVQGKDPARAPIYHLLHIASSPPDAALRPMWNDSPDHDSFSWDSLPIEFKKRNISTSLISLSPKLTPLSDLYSSVSVGLSSKPWFPVQAPHSLHLMGYYSVSTPKITKRPNESVNHISDRPNDGKRPRLNQPVLDASSPSHLAPKASPITPHLLAAVPKTSLPPNMQTPPQLPVAQLSLGTHHQAVEHLRLAEERIQLYDLKIKQARAAGDTELAEKLLLDFTKFKEKHNDFKTAVLNYAQSQKAATLQQSLAPQAKQLKLQESPSGISRMQSSPSRFQKDDPPTGATSGEISHSGSPNLPSMSGGVVQGGQHNRTASTTSVFPTMSVDSSPSIQPQGLFSSSSSMNTQIQKVMEQQQRAHAPIQTGGTGVGLNIQDVATETSSTVHTAPGGSTSQAQANGSSIFESPAKAGTQPFVSRPVWSGPLCWSGTSTSGKKEVRTYVIAATAAVSDSHAETWPKSFTLAPTREPSVSSTDLQAWIRRFKPTLAKFQFDSRAQDPKLNEIKYRQMVQLLTTKQLYATASWTLPSGEQKTNVLFFPINNIGLIGAFFPLSGIPEMPKSSTPGSGTTNPSGVPSGLSGLNLQPHILNQLQQMNPEQRKIFLVHLMQRQQQARLLARQNATEGGAGGTGPSANNMAMQQPSANNTAMQQQQNPQQQQAQNLPGNLHTTSHTQMGGNLNGLQGMGGAAGGGDMGSSPVGLQSPIHIGGQRPVGGPTSSMPSTFTYEMMQSFMQRSAEGNGNGGMGAG